MLSFDASFSRVVSTPSQRLLCNHNGYILWRTVIMKRVGIAPKCVKSQNQLVLVLVLVLFMQ